MSEEPLSDSRQAVLEAAIAAFARKGYAGTSIQDILHATGLSRPTLYYYFKSKSGLFRAILDFAYDECFRMMKEGANARAECEERLVAIAAAVFEFARRHESLTRLLFATVFAAPEEIPMDAIDNKKRRRNFEFVLEVVRLGVERGELDASFTAQELAHGIFGAISHQTRMHLLEPKSRLDRRRAKRVVLLFFQGAQRKRR